MTVATERKSTGVSTRERDFAVGEVYHVYQRGNHGKRTFLDANARLRYLTRLFELSREHGVLVHNFCLMANHIHFVLEPQVVDGISKMMQLLQQVHAREHNLRLKKGGNLWQQHFGCKHVDSESYYLTVMKYVELNPVVCRRAGSAAEYLWSGARVHTVGQQVEIQVGDQRVTTNLYLEGWKKRSGELSKDWLRYLLGRQVDEAAMEKIRAMLDGKKRQAMAQTERAKRRREQAIGEPKVQQPPGPKTATIKASKTKQIGQPSQVRRKVGAQAARPVERVSAAASVAKVRVPKMQVRAAEQQAKPPSKASDKSRGAS